MTSCIMGDARVGRSRDKERTTQKHGKDTARIYALGSMKTRVRVQKCLAFSVPDSCNRTYA
jgi:hypothetical protein